jgi:hypothetical protein
VVAILNRMETEQKDMLDGEDPEKKIYQKMLLVKLIN